MGLPVFNQASNWSGGQTDSKRSKETEPTVRLTEMSEIGLQLLQALTPFTPFFAPYVFFMTSRPVVDLLTDFWLLPVEKKKKTGAHCFAACRPRSSAS